MLSEYWLLRDIVKGFEDLRGALEVSCPGPVECPGISREIEPLSLMAPWGMSRPAFCGPENSRLGQRYLLH